MKTEIYRNKIISRAHEALSYDSKALGLPSDSNGGFWKDYKSEIAGLPAEMRRNGCYLAFAYLLERNHVKKPKDKIHAAGKVLDDIRRIDEEINGKGVLPGPSETPQQIGEFVHSLRNISEDGATYMRRADELFDIVDFLKQVANQKKILEDLARETRE